MTDTDAQAALAAELRSISPWKDDDTFETVWDAEAAILVAKLAANGWRLVPAAAVPDADSLGAAWAEAEAALPEGWEIKSMSMDAPPEWQAWAGGTPEETREGDAWEAESGPTPPAALRALAAKLREVGR